MDRTATITPPIWATIAAAILITAPLSPVR
jgi:hypothetical protein